MRRFLWSKVCELKVNASAPIRHRRRIIATHRRQTPRTSVGYEKQKYTATVLARHSSPAQTTSRRPRYRPARPFILSLPKNLAGVAIPDQVRDDHSEYVRPIQYIVTLRLTQLNSFFAAILRLHRLSAGFKKSAECLQIWGRVRAMISP